MKKLMIAASAALCAAVGFADVTSANVVGYSNYPLADGTCMAGAAFNRIAQTKTTLTQVIPQGYLESPTYITMSGKQTSKGCLGEITVTFLDDRGNPCKDKAGNTMTYYWKHTYKKTGGWQNDQHWYQVQGAEEVTIDSSNDVDIPAGQGLWFKVLSGWTEDFNFNVAGEAMMDAGTVPLKDGTTPIIVPISKACTLLDITPKGYLESSTYITMSGKQTSKGCLGEITVTYLDDRGNPCKDKAGNTMTYYWKHTYKKTGGWQNDQHWYQVQGAEEVTIDESNAPEIKMGEGLWVKVLSGWTNTFCIEGPGVDDSATAE